MAPSPRRTTPESTNVYGVLVAENLDKADSAEEKLTTTCEGLGRFDTYEDHTGLASVAVNAFPDTWSDGHLDDLLETLNELGCDGVTGYIEIIAKGDRGGGATVAVLTPHGLYREYREFLNLPKGTWLE